MTMATQATTDVRWDLKGEWFDVCSCKLPCPCTFAQEPTYGDCLFTLVWQVHEGQFNGIKLDGLSVVAIGEVEGNQWVEDLTPSMKLLFYIDEQADERQRNALKQIFTGKAGGWPSQFGKLFSEIRGIEYAPIEVKIADDLSYWRAVIPGKVIADVEALSGPTADPNRRVQLYNPPGSETGSGQVATWGIVKESQAIGFDYSHPFEGQSSKHIPFDWRMPE
ncbi:MAG: hypothetical protein CLLPBCKN_007508 [Chroococcidiopsis cubana SAG 39.79]|uniref:DUF1326 domain-containing protein n=1 Tax=Chroococcidiopsis cubana SAG 39.79 TaxID=388085 RepID=A0AB37UTD8_9CYAN|nr:DUF1326 domain-containing protein [Chroococcidiopsis cubana]MDZ4878073.1 hypothetical protein [Chroococcidiopsis cubana SAG 39.79]PSB66507.1 hypothetical protein C7B79_00685 [Chroococcidiopsis cubana CCALA 043]RUT14648.1 hypothetical protein DSM107010_01940 [Chroococcidiopsis cubana SAG 39.79]